MKKIFVLVCGLMALCIVLPGLTFAGAALPIVVDEWGNGFYGTLRLGWWVDYDSSQGLPAPTKVLYYQLPGHVTPGDVWMTEPGQGAGTYSDVIRFWSSSTSNASFLIFYSDFETGVAGQAPADTGLPTFPGLTLYRILPESGTEGGYQGLLYYPGTADPGYSAAINGYRFVSDVPLPAAVWLFGPGLLGIGILRRKFKG